MNNGLMRLTQTENVPKLPELASNKCSRLITKHYTNLGLYLNQNELVLFNWLVYQTSIDNTFTYSTQLLRRYNKSVLDARIFYGIKNNGVKITIKFAREILISLIKKGYIFRYKGDKMIINPMLVYYQHYPRKDYIKFTRDYQNAKDNLPKILNDYVLSFRKK